MTEDPFFPAELEAPVRNLVLYVFAIELAEAFTQALNSLPAEEVGYFQVWNATKVRGILFQSESQRIADLVPVWCLSVDFRPEHSALRAQAEQLSLFYQPEDPADRRFTNEFFNSVPAEYTPEMLAYLAEIGKVAG